MIHRSALWRTCVLGAVSAASFGCGSEPSSALGDVDGTITVAGTTLPVVGVSVRVGDQFTETDPAGRFQFQGIGVGDLPVVAVKAGYENFYGTVHVVVGGTATLHIPMVPFGNPLEPRGLAAMPLLGSGEIYLSWPPVDRAASYTLYWSTTAGVTPATGTAIPNVQSPYYHTNLVPGATYYYVLTSAGETGQGAPSPEAHATAGNGIQVSITITNHPLARPPEFVGDVLPLLVGVTSTFSIVDVSAAVEDRRVTLIFSPELYDQWAGQIALDGLPSPQLRQVTVTARDVNGTVAEGSAPFRHDRQAAGSLAMSALR